MDIKKFFIINGVLISVLTLVLKVFVPGDDFLYGTVFGLGIGFLLVGLLLNARK